MSCVNLQFFINHPHWPVVEGIAKTLIQHGHRAVLAGGCVRDALLGKLAKDLDIATDATPEQIEGYFPKVLPLGKSFGVCRVIENSIAVEVATFREDFDYQDGRRPGRVHYSTLEKDAFRRDFTINALFYDLQSQELIDVVGGTKDLNDRILRAVGNPDVRFSEDYLRILRGIRFSGVLHFPLQAKTRESMQRALTGLKKVSKERVFEELEKMFASTNSSECWKLLDDLSVLPIIFEEWPQTMNSMQQWLQQITPYDDRQELSWVAMYYFLYSVRDEAFATRQFTTLKVPKRYMKKALDVISARAVLDKNEDISLLAFMECVRDGSKTIAKLFWSIIDQNNSFKAAVENMEKQYLKDGEPPAPLINGNDLLAHGYKGEEIKKVLQKSYLRQLRQPALDKQALLQYVVKVK